MPYDLKYKIEFKNADLDTYRIEIWSKDFTGDDTILTGATNPFVQRYQGVDEKLIPNINASEAEINLFSETFLSLIDFYSEDDEQYRVDFYCEKINNRQGTQLVYSATKDVVVTAIDATTYQVVISNESATHGIEAGMLLDILGATVDIISVSLNTITQELTLIVDGVLPVGAFAGEDFSILEYTPTTLEKLLWRGFIVQDDCRAQFQDPPYAIQLTATDNIALLKDVSFDIAAAGKKLSTLSVPIEVISNVGAATVYFNPGLGFGDVVTVDGTQYTLSNAIYNPATNVLTLYFADSIANGDYTLTLETTLLIDKLLLIDYLRICIQYTGIVLPVRIFVNIFENSHNQGATDEPFSQTRMFSGIFLSDSGEWKDCYYILEQILKTFDATLIQADGYWNIIRQAELYTAANNEVHGVEFDENFENPVSINLLPNFIIQRRTESEFLNADAVELITRPKKSVQWTFNYEQPAELIRGADLTLLGPLIGTSTDVIDGVSVRLDRYAIPPFWSHESSTPNSATLDASYIVVVTDISKDTVIDRYIYQPWTDYSFKSLEFNPIEVSKRDYIDFSLAWKNTTTSGGGFPRFKVRFLLVTPAGHSYNLGLSSLSDFAWIGPVTNPVNVDTLWRVNIGAGQVDGAQDITDYQGYDLFENNPLTPPIFHVPSFPEDGMLRIGIQGVSNPNHAYPPIDIKLKDIRLTVHTTINESTSVVAQTHFQTQPENIKNIINEDVSIDDSPSNTIKGTLFTNDLSTFLTGIGPIYFTKTVLWNRRNITEERRLGELTSFEQKLFTRIARTRVEGTFSGMRNGTRFISPLSVAAIDTLPNLNFIFGIASFNYMNNSIDANLKELYKTGEQDSDVDSTYTFEYLYDTK